MTRLVATQRIVQLNKQNGERYVFIFDDASRPECLRQLGLFASNPELSFTWHDAALLSQKIREDKATP